MSLSSRNCWISIVQHEGEPVLNLMKSVYLVLKTIIQPKRTNYFAGTQILNEIFCGHENLSVIGSVSLDFRHFNICVMITHFNFNCMSLIKHTMCFIQHLFWNEFLFIQRNKKPWCILIKIFSNIWKNNILHSQYKGRIYLWGNHSLGGKEKLILITTYLIHTLQSFVANRDSRKKKKVKCDEHLTYQNERRLAKKGTGMQK